MKKLIKDYLGISTNDYDTQIEANIEVALSICNTVLGDILYGEKTQFVDINNVKDNGFGLLYVNPKEITKLNGEDYSGKTQPQDYVIQSNGIVKFFKLPNLHNWMGLFEVKYNAGWNIDSDNGAVDIPHIIVSAIGDYVGANIAKDNGTPVKRITTGPRTVEYAIDGQNDEQIKKSLIAKLKAFIPLHLRVYAL